jgi:heat shock protein HspQ
MIDKKQIPYMISLINDDSSSVRENVLKSFTDFGSDLYHLLEENPSGLNDNGMNYLFKQLTEYIMQNPAQNTLSQIKIGDKIKHKKYQYDGLIVDIDFYCFANDDWYKKNNTQPDKLQPWYHVLVNGSSMVTYAAQSSVESTSNSQGMNHPYVTHFFDKNENGDLVRNDKPWPREY